MSIIVVMRPGWREWYVGHVTGTTVARVTDAVRRDAVRNMNVRTGFTRRTIRSHTWRTEGRVFVGPPRKWFWLEYGTPPHIITPRFRQALWWPDKVPSNPTARVRHPGIRPYAPMRRALFRKRRLRPV